MKRISCLLRICPLSLIFSTFLFKFSVGVMVATVSIHYFLIMALMIGLQSMPLDWLPQNEKEFIKNTLVVYLYDTELPDNPDPEDGIGDSIKNHIYFNADESLVDDSAPVRAQEEYYNVLDFLELNDYQGASKTLGIMSHYIVDMSTFGHVMSSSTSWDIEKVI